MAYDEDLANRIRELVADEPGLTEKHGDEAAAEVARKFRRTMRGLSRRHGAWEVKTMGDGIMLWVSNAAQAIALAAGAVEQVQASVDLPPVRVGVHTGPAVMQGSDWFGSAVNVAARLADEAAPGEALISAATRSAACGAMTGPLLTGPLMTGREIVLRGLERPIVAWRLG